MEKSRRHQDRHRRPRPSLRRCMARTCLTLLSTAPSCHGYGPMLTTLGRLPSTTRSTNAAARSRSTRSSSRTRSIPTVATSTCTDCQCSSQAGGERDVGLDDVRRVFAISDLHTDDAANMDWLIDRCTGRFGGSTSTSTSTSTGTSTSSASHGGFDPPLTPGPKDALVIAGDISHRLETIERSLSVISDHLGCHTFFVPGNHEAWVGGKEMDEMGLTSSFDKLQRVMDVCDRLGVHTKHKLVGSNHRRPAWIVPIWSWYDGTLALPGCEDLCDGFGQWPWVDFARCKWGEEFLGSVDDQSSRGDSRFTIPGFERIPSQRLVKKMLSRNDGSVATVKEHLERCSAESRDFPGLISMTHFSPCRATLPDWKDPSSDTFLRKEWLDHSVPEVSAKFAYVSGSQLIDDQIRSMSDDAHRHLHVFGHSHRPKDFIRAGIRYVHNPVGKPVEREMNMISKDFDFKLVWDATTYDGEISAPTLVRYWEEQGGGLEMLSRNLSKRERRRQQQMKRRTK